MREFVKEVLPYRSNFIDINIPTREVVFIQEAVLKALDLDNLNKLRDRYEGVAFYNNYVLKALSMVALEKHLKTDLVDWAGVNPKTFNAQLDSGGMLINVFSCEYGELPKINVENDIPAIITMKQKNERSVVICGFASVKALNTMQNQDYLDGVMATGDKTIFTGFEELIQFTDIQELRAVYEKNR